MAKLAALDFKRGLNVFTQGNPERVWPHRLQTISISNLLASTTTPSETDVPSIPVTVSKTRPNDTITYSIGDVIGDSTSTTAAMQFVGIGTAGGVIRITGSRHEIDVASLPSGLTSFRLHVYSATPPSAYVDNVAWDLPAGDRPYYLGYVDLGSPVDVGSTLYVQQTGLDYDFVLTTADLFAYLVTNGTYTPSALAVKTTTLYAMPM
jgi:hypothetical protein